MLAATLASLRKNNLHVFCVHSEQSTVIMLSDCWLKWHVSCVWYYLYMAILHAHVPSFVSASRCMALLLSVICLALSQHHTAQCSWFIQHSWSQHHVAWLSCASASRQSPGSHARSDVPSSSYPQFVPHPRFAQAIHGLRKTIHGWSRSTEQLYYSR